MSTRRSVRRSTATSCSTTSTSRTRTPGARFERRVLCGRAGAGDRVGRRDRRGEVERGEARSGARTTPKRPVRVDGLDLRRLDLASYRARLGIVPQDAFVFHGTVASNIAYGRPDAARTEIEAAVRAVGAADVLGLLAGGLDHVVEEDGTNLTTAQRQLIALAHRGSPIPTCSCSTRPRPHSTRHSNAR